MSQSNDSGTPQGPFSNDEIETLRCLVAAMIPPDGEFGVPGADDAPIFEEILTAAARDPDALRKALATLDALSLERHDSTLTVLDAENRARVVEAFSHSGAPCLEFIVGITVQCYYRDDRVLRSLSLEARAPFPAGFALEQGDWSLLEPVRRRAPMYRKT